MNHVLDSSEKHELLALGGSRTKNNLSTLVIDSVKKINSYNAGMYGFGLVESKMMLQCYLNSHHPKPDIIVLTMPENLKNPTSEIGYPAQYYPYLENDIISNTLSKYDPNVCLLKKYPILSLTKYDDHLKYVAMIPYIKSKHASHNLFKGYEVMEGTLKDPSKIKKEIIRNDALLKADKNQLSAFYDLCNYTYTQKIKMVIILAPTFQKTLDTLPSPLAVFLKNKQGILHYTMLDFTNDSLCLNPALFYDRQHLNASGSKIFTTKVVGKL